MCALRNHEGNRLVSSPMLSSDFVQVAAAISSSASPPGAIHYVEKGLPIAKDNDCKIFAEALRSHAGDATAALLI